MNDKSPETVCHVSLTKGVRLNNFDFDLILKLRKTSKNFVIGNSNIVLTGGRTTGVLAVDNVLSEFFFFVCVCVYMCGIFFVSVCVCVFGGRVCVCVAFMCVGGHDLCMCVCVLGESLCV